MNLQSISVNGPQMINCTYGLLLLHRLMFDLEFAVLFCPSTLNVSLERSPIEQQTELAKQEPSTIAERKTSADWTFPEPHHKAPHPLFQSVSHQLPRQWPSSRRRRRPETAFPCPGNSRRDPMALSSTMKSNTMKRLVLDLSLLMLYTILCSCHECQHH